MGTVKRADLARILSSELGCSKTLARPAVDTAFEALIGAISRGNRLRFGGLGPGPLRRRTHGRTPVIPRQGNGSLCLRGGRWLSNPAKFSRRRFQDHRHNRLRERYNRLPAAKYLGAQRTLIKPFFTREEMLGVVKEGLDQG